MKIKINSEYFCFDYERGFVGKVVVKVEPFGGLPEEWGVRIVGAKGRLRWVKKKYLHPIGELANSLYGD